MAGATSKANQDHLYDLLSGYAERGEPMPPNRELADRMGWADRRTVMLALRALEKDKRLKVHSSQQRQRVVEILGTGKRTADRPDAKPLVEQPAPQTDLERRRALLESLAMKSKLGTVNPGPSLGGFRARPLAKGEGCRWIDGDDYLDKIKAGQDPTCGKPRLLGRSYCEHHQARAFAPKRERAA
jgi:hypothetical protein